MAESPSGGLSLPASKLITMVSNSATFQTLVSAANAAAALASIYYPAEPGDTFSRPCALVGDGDDWMARSVAMGAGFTYAYEGALWLAFEVDIQAGYQAGGQERNAHYWFTNRVGPIIDEVLALSGTSTHLAIREVSRLMVSRVALEEEDAGNFWYRGEFNLEWQ